MSKKIPCPYCDGSGWYLMTTDQDGGTDEIQCAVCEGSKAIPDRRVPTAGDRAVERIMELANCYGLVDMDKIVSIIGEEEARDAVSK